MLACIVIELPAEVTDAPETVEELRFNELADAEQHEDPVE
jgi:hypothetical protein